MISVHYHCVKITIITSVFAFFEMQIWEDILGFDKAEFYLKRWPQLDGMQFKDVLVSFPEAIPCGVKVAGDEGRIVLNPNDDYILSEGDEVLVIAEDDDTYAPASLPKVFNLNPELFCAFGFI